MNLLVIISKVLVLLTCSGVALGFGVGGSFGMLFTFSGERFESAVFLLSLGALGGMMFFGWIAWKLTRMFFLARPKPGQDIDSYSSFLV